MLYSNLGYAYFGEHKYDESIASFRQALAIDPQLRAQLFARGFAAARSLGERPRKVLLLVGEIFCRAGNFDAADLSPQGQEEGFASMNQVKTDPSFPRC